MTPELRPFEERDRAAVVDLWSEAFPDESSHNVSSEIIDRKTRIQPELFLIAELDGVVVGAVMAGFDGVRGWLHRLAVRTPLQRDLETELSTMDVRSWMGRLGIDAPKKWWKRRSRT